MELISVRLLTDDLAASVAFWRDVMELKLAYSIPDSYAYFETSTAGVELMPRSAVAEQLGRELPTGGGAATLTFKVPDVDAAFARLCERGAPAVSAPQNRPELSLRIACVRDPAGYLVEVYAPLAQEDSAT